MHKFAAAAEPIFVSSVLLTREKLKGQRIEEGGETVMDARWNNIVDTAAVRIGTVVVGFGVWLAICYGLLSS